MPVLHNLSAIHPADLFGSIPVMYPVKDKRVTYATKTFTDEKEMKRFAFYKDSDFVMDMLQAYINQVQWQLDHQLFGASNKHWQELYPPVLAELANLKGQLQGYKYYPAAMHEVADLIDTQLQIVKPRKNSSKLPAWLVIDTLVCQYRDKYVPKIQYV